MWMHIQYNSTLSVHDDLTDKVVLKMAGLVVPLVVVGPLQLHTVLVVAPVVRLVHVPVGIGEGRQAARPAPLALRRYVVTARPETPPEQLCVSIIKKYVRIPASVSTIII